MLSVSSALLVALSGMVIVFIMLAILAGMIVVISKVVAAVTARQEGQAATPAAEGPVAQEARTPAGPFAGEVALVDVDEKTAACVMAIVSHETGIPLSELVFHKIKAL